MKRNLLAIALSLPLQRSFTDYHIGEAMIEMAGWLRAGKLTYREDIVDGFENLPKAFIGLFEGENTGKRLVKA